MKLIQIEHFPTTMALVNQRWITVAVMSVLIYRWDSCGVLRRWKRYDNPSPASQHRLQVHICTYGLRQRNSAVMRAERS
jgi:hypothetical protein